MHTPGPWFCDDTAIMCDDNYCVAWVRRSRKDDEGTLMSSAEVQDNARLIASAPSLLSSLIAAADELSGLSQCKGTDDIVIAARAAIELATGDKYAEREVSDG